HPGPAHPGMATPQRGEPEGAVLARVLLVAHAHERHLQEPDHHGHHLLARQPPAPEVPGHPPPDARQGAGEVDHAAVFVLVPHLAPAVVVAVLLAAAGVAPRGLDVPIGEWADPDVGPGRRNRERPYPVQRGGIRERFPRRCEIAETLTLSPPADPRRLVGHVAPARLAGILHPLLERLCHLLSSMGRVPGPVRAVTFAFCQTLSVPVRVAATRLPGRISLLAPWRPDLGHAGPEAALLASGGADTSRRPPL